MTSISNTSFPALEALFVAAIEGVTPRQTYQGAEGWKHHDKSEKSPARTRRFRVVLTPGGPYLGGYFTNSNNETQVDLAVRTDYAGQHEKLQWIVQDDWHQLRDVLAALAADSTNGLTWLQTTRQPPGRVAGTPAARSRVSAGEVVDADTFQIDLTYQLRYMQAQAA